MTRGVALRWLALAALGLLAALPAAAQRRAVLEQIRVPHSYYYREMYLPQLTSGPSSAAWTPDGAALVYSMAGSLWRQSIGTTEAAQLTDGPGYDYQPDVSPDGRWIVFSSYRNDAVELHVLETATGLTRPLLADGAVHLDPRFSPDGSRLAFVSTAHEGRWHVYVGDFAAGSLTGVARITEDRDAGLPRYYYSTYDHYLSPTWSPDGREVILVSNAGRIWGSGGFWRMEARVGAAPRSVHHEETTWRARPDWAPDGRRLVYASYLGRQWHQLWLIPANGGDPFQLTYGDFDATAPRWSPDGRRIAFVSNEDGNVGLRVVTVPGGAVQRVEPTRRLWRVERRRLSIVVQDPAGRPTPARVSVTGADGRGHAPWNAWIHADDAFDRSQRLFETTYFHANGRADLDLAPGTYVIEVTKGLEHGRVVDTVVVGSTSVFRTVRLQPIADLVSAGWWSGDLHVHMNYGGAYRNTPPRLRFQAEAEDLRVVENLIVNKEGRIPDIGYFSGRLDPASSSTTLIKHDEEYHTSYWGHTGLLGLSQHFIQPNYAAYVNTAAASLFPHNSAIAEMARAQGAVTGYVHPFDLPPAPGGPDPVTSGLPVDAVLGRLSYLEVVGFSDHRATADVWYRLLNTGIRLPAGAGTDAMANFASLRGPVGLCRVYVRTPRLEYRAWLDGLAAGRTFVTNGPLLGFVLGGEQAGATLRLGRGPHRLAAAVWLRSIVAVDSLEIVRNGAVIARLAVEDGGTRADTTLSISVDGSGWYVLRAYATGSRHPTLDVYPYATTSPVYVTVNDAPIRSTEDAAFFVRWIEGLEDGARSHEGWNTPEEREVVLADLRRAREEFARRGSPN